MLGRFGDGPTTWHIYAGPIPRQDNPVKEKRRTLDFEIRIVAKVGGAFFGHLSAIQTLVNYLVSEPRTSTRQGSDRTIWPPVVPFGGKEPVWLITINPQPPGNRGRSNPTAVRMHGVVPTAQLSLADFAEIRGALAKVSEEGARLALCSGVSKVLQLNH